MREETCRRSAKLVSACVTGRRANDNRICFHHRGDFPSGLVALFATVLREPVRYPPDGYAGDERD